MQKMVINFVCFFFSPSSNNLRFTKKMYIRARNFKYLDINTLSTFLFVFYLKIFYLMLLFIYKISIVLKQDIPDWNKNGVQKGYDNFCDQTWFQVLISDKVIIFPSNRWYKNNIFYLPVNTNSCGNTEENTKYELTYYVVKECRQQ